MLTEEVVSDENEWKRDSKGVLGYITPAIAKSPPIATGIQGFMYDIRTAILPFILMRPDFMADYFFHEPLLKYWMYLIGMGIFVLLYLLQWLRIRKIE